ncbi:hypothetical protein COO60DRAFT_360942 [Scenedesmus sp. NREL 46B-D3]|nr:hypothetical protein COO60DRAFT_360942 [Scenedesmus sp. NREL 46B-D3]
MMVCRPSAASTTCPNDFWRLHRLRNRIDMHVQLATSASRGKQSPAAHHAECTWDSRTIAPRYATMMLETSGTKSSHTDSYHSAQGWCISHRTRRHACISQAVRHGKRSTQKVQQSSQPERMYMRCKRKATAFKGGQGNLPLLHRTHCAEVCDCCSALSYQANSPSPLAGSHVPLVPPNACRANQFVHIPSSDREVDTTRQSPHG